MIEALAQKANANRALRHRGRFLSTTFLLQVGNSDWLITIVNGEVTSVAKGPFVMPNWVFALRADSESWAGFWAADPKPGFHDLFALIKHGRLKAQGNLHPFMANLFYFKELLATLREQRPA